MPFDLHHPECITRVMLYSCNDKSRPWELAGVTNSWRQTVLPKPYGWAGAKVWKNVVCVTSPQASAGQTKNEDVTTRIPDGSYFYSIGFDDQIPFPYYVFAGVESFGYSVIFACGGVLDMTQFKSVRTIGSQFCCSGGADFRIIQSTLSKLHNIQRLKTPEVVSFVPSANYADENDRNHPCALERISSEFFHMARDLREVLFPQTEEENLFPNLTVIPKGFLSCCRNLQRVDFGVFWQNITVFEDRVLYFNSSLKEIIFAPAKTTSPSRLTKIGQLCFSDNEMVEEVNFSNFFYNSPNLQEIGEYFCGGCEKLKSVVFPACCSSVVNKKDNHKNDDDADCENVFSIGHQFLSSSPSLPKINFGTFLSRCNKIGSHFLSDAKSLKEIVWISSSGVNNDTSEDGYHRLPNLREIGKAFLCASVSLKTLDLTALFSSPKLTVIGDDFLRGCTALENLIFINNKISSGDAEEKKILLSGIRNLGDAFLYDCSSLKSVDLSAFQALESLPPNLCMKNTKLEKVILPRNKNISAIHFSVFHSCPNLVDINLESDVFFSDEHEGVPSFIHDSFFESEVMKMGRFKERNKVSLSEGMKKRAEQAVGKF